MSAFERSVLTSACISYLSVNSEAAGVSGPMESGFPTTSAIDGLGRLPASSRIRATSSAVPLTVFTAEVSAAPPESLGDFH